MIKKIISLLIKLKLIERTFAYGIKSKNGAVIYYNDPYGVKIMNLVNKIRKEIDMLMHNNEAYQIYSAVEKTAKIEGDIAEVGVYKGGSAKLICEAKETKNLHLFDTFNGLPNLSEKDNPNQFHAGQYSASLEKVQTAFT